MYLFKAENVSKSFGGIRALKNVSLNIKKGEVLGLAGENGAGKSTLIKIICGVHKLTEGKLYFEGKEFSPRDPSDAEDTGISVFHQEIPICPNLSISANVFLGQNIPSNGVRPDWKAMNQKTKDLFHNLLGEDIDPTKLIRNCSVAEQQLSLFVRVLSRDAKLVILDEPTTALTPPEVEKLFNIIARLKAQGISFIFVSHMLDEFIKFCDRITVFRDGENAGDLEKEDFDTRKISSMIAGRDLDYGEKKERVISTEPILELKNISTAKSLKNVDLTLHKGEILGIAGLQGSGRSELPQALFGVDPIKEGSVLLNGKPLSLNSPQDAIANKIGYVPEDRKTLGLFTQMDIKTNMAVAGLDRVRGPFGLLKKKAIKDTSAEMQKKLSIKMSGDSAAITSLSGGNQQKVLISRWFSLKPDILLMNEPVRGVDVGAKEEICKLITSLSEEGFSFIVATTEIEELMTMSDRILVMRKGKIAASLNKNEFSKEKIIFAATAE